MGSYRSAWWAGVALRPGGVRVALGWDWKGWSGEGLGGGVAATRFAGASSERPTALVKE